ncbi:MAG: hypothetical protein A2143_06310 [Gallionellales bacterium RBG_16_57_15]|nr:MAG: hypothetical protein A2143_06310 [Gallionellales bacterium RBG_16_57_15]
MPLNDFQDAVVPSFPKGALLFPPLEKEGLGGIRDAPNMEIPLGPPFCEVSKKPPIPAYPAAKGEVAR